MRKTITLTIFFLTLFSFVVPSQTQSSPQEKSLKVINPEEELKRRAEEGKEKQEEMLKEVRLYLYGKLAWEKAFNKDPKIENYMINTLRITETLKSVLDKIDDIIITKAYLSHAMVRLIPQVGVHVQEFNLRIERLKEELTQEQTKLKEMKNQVLYINARLNGEDPKAYSVPAVSHLKKRSTEELLEFKQELPRRYQQVKANLNWINAELNAYKGFKSMQSKLDGRILNIKQRLDKDTQNLKLLRDDISAKANLILANLNFLKTYTEPIFQLRSLMEHYSQQTVAIDGLLNQVQTEFAELDTVDFSKIMNFDTSIDIPKIGPGISGIQSGWESLVEEAKNTKNNKGGKR